MMVRDTESGAAPKGRSVEDCPRDNAKRYVRAWAREAWRAEGAESLAARRPTTDFRQVRGKCFVWVISGGGGGGGLYRHGRVLKNIMRRRSKYSP